MQSPAIDAPEATPYVPAMARIPLIDPDDETADASGREALLAIRRAAVDWPADPSEMNILRAMANNGPALSGFMGLLEGGFLGGHVDRALTELAYLTASAVNECHY